jgi:hypothetical protein
MKPLPCVMICLIGGTLLFACTGDNARPASSGAHGAAPQTATIQIDTSKAANSYANFCRVTGTPEEVIVDFGLNATPIGVPADPIKIDQRIVMNFYTAKRFLIALEVTIQQHEETFGELELDVQKRVQR